MTLDPSMLRVDSSNYDRYAIPEPKKVGFFKKLGRTMGKVLSFTAPIGAAVTAIALPGVGLPIAAGLYGLGQFSRDQVIRSQAKEQAELANQPANLPITMPGFFGEAMGAGDAATNFIAPQSLENYISPVIINRQGAQQDAIMKQYQ